MLAKLALLSLPRPVSVRTTSCRYFSAISSVYPWPNSREAVTWAEKPGGDAVVEFVSSGSALSSRFGSAFAADFDNSSNGSYHFVHSGDSRLIVIKVSDSEPKVRDVRSAVSAAVGVARKTKSISTLSVDLSTKSLSPALQDAAIQAAVLSNYQFSRHASDSGIKKHRTLGKLEFVGCKPNEPLISKLEATLLARNVANERADIMNPQAIEDIARDLATKHGLKITVVAGNELLDRGMNLFHAVGQAAQVPPRLVLLEYRGDDSSPDRISAVIGKGVCFDSGGLNLKPTGSIETMHFDKGGAAAVLGAAFATAKLQPRCNAVFALALAENAIDSKAYKPHAILKSLMGHTVEVRNTDAEGRLMLADAMTFTQQQYKPHAIVDVATLTGACVVGLGEYIGGLFANDDKLAETLSTIGNTTFERVWRLPILPEHSSELENPNADIASTGSGRMGGACTAAAFLQKFVNKGVQWAHLDIAGPAMYSKPRGEFPAGATGFGARLLTEWVASQEQ